VELQPRKTEIDTKKLKTNETSNENTQESELKTRKINGGGDYLRGMLDRIT
jgi:hypothetical protein